MTPTDGNTDKFTFDDARKYIQLKNTLKQASAAKTAIGGVNCLMTSNLLPFSYFTS